MDSISSKRMKRNKLLFIYERCNAELRMSPDVMIN